MTLSLDGFATMKLVSNQSNVMSSSSKDARTSDKCLPVEYKVLPSAKLQTFEFVTTKSISLMNMLNRNGPYMELCGTPDVISSHEL